jgi:IclR-like helix-turn-helix domain-containing protein
MSRRRPADEVLAVLAHAETPLSGLDIAQQTGLPPGSFHATLAELEGKGLIQSWWEPTGPGRPRRRVYRILPGALLVDVQPPRRLTTPCGVVVAAAASLLIVLALVGLWYAADLVAR